MTVSPDPQQYSDLVTFMATITPGSCGVGQAATTVEFFVGTQSVGTVGLSLNVATNTLEGTLTAPLLETPTNPSNGQMAPGVHAVEAVFGGVNPSFNVSNPTTDITITQEDAVVEYVGQSLQATPSASSSATTVVLTANIQDFDDGNRGDIRNAKVKFVNRDSNTDISGWIPVVDLVNPADNTLGTVSFDWFVDIGTQDAVSFDVGIVVGFNTDLDKDEGYYMRNHASDNTLITVYKPVGDFITGGGYIRPDNSAGEYASTDGLKTNFGFNVGYNKKGNKLKGHMNILFRIEQIDGVHTYQIKGNAIQTLGVDISDPDAKFAEFITKANLTDVTNPQAPIALGGNLILKVELTDRGEPGTDDSIGINLTKRGRLLYSSNWTGISTDEMMLSAGNILVHSGFSLAKDVTVTPEDPFTISNLEVLSWPNPSDSHFNIKLNTKNNVDKIDIQVYDVNNKLVHANKFEPYEEYRFGERLEAGVYIVKISQADKVYSVRLIKF